MGVDPVLPQRRQIRRIQTFDKTSSAQDVEFTPEGILVSITLSRLLMKPLVLLKQDSK